MLMGSNLTTLVKYSHRYAPPPFPPPPPKAYTSSDQYDTLVLGIQEMKVANITPMMMAPEILFLSKTAMRKSVQMPCVWATYR